MNGPEIVRRYFDAWNARNADAILETFGAGGTYQDPSTGAPISGEALRAYVTGLWSAFPDLNFVEESLGEMAPNLIAAQWLMQGTNSGSMAGLPPTGKPVSVRGADFIRLENGKIKSVTGYFDKGEVPRQIGLNVIVQPSAIGPFQFGIAVSVQTGRTQEPGAFSITSINAVDDAAVTKIRERSREAMIDMLKMDGFIGAVAGVLGKRLVTISAWDSPEASRAVMSQGRHAEAMRLSFDGAITDGGFTSVWTNHHFNPVLIRCDGCGKINRTANGNKNCGCGAVLPKPPPYW
jgi:steroid delta-isomerase-like uncharacterized protein